MKIKISLLIWLAKLNIITNSQRSLFFMSFAVFAIWSFDCILIDVLSLKQHAVLGGAEKANWMDFFRALIVSNVPSWNAGASGHTRIGRL